MGEKIKFIGMLVLSFSVLCLAAAIGYFGYELERWRKQIPEILNVVGDTSGQIAPVLEHVSEIEKLIPPIVEEVEVARKTVDGVVAEVENTRKALPGILEDLEPITRQIESTTRQLPEIIDPLLVEVGKTREVIPDILGQVQATNEEVAKVRELIPGILDEIRYTNATVGTAVTEIQQTREAIPGIMDRADQIVANAGEAGKQAGKGAMTGMIGGIVAAPFGLVGGIGRELIGSESSEGAHSLTEEDQQIFTEKLLNLAENGNEGDVVTWQNRKTSNGGKITLLRKFVENDQECREVLIETTIQGRDPETRTLSGCRQPDGSWIAPQ